MFLTLCGCAYSIQLSDLYTHINEVKVRADLWVTHLALLSSTVNTVLQMLAFGHRKEVCSELGNPDGSGQESREGRTWKVDGSSWGFTEVIAVDSKEISEQSDGTLRTPIWKSNMCEE